MIARKEPKWRLASGWQNSFNGTAHLIARKGPDFNWEIAQPMCFNGTAHLIARKGVCCWASNWLKKCFNGTAHLIARKDRYYLAVPIGENALQWDRAFDSAEGGRSETCGVS